MLGIRSYTQEYIDACRSRMDSDIAAFRQMVAAARPQPAGDKAPLNPAMEAFEATFFNNMVLLLDYLFVHRLRTVEGKDGNPLNEVRILCNSMLLNDNIMTADKSIKLSPEGSVLKYRVGDKIKLTEADFLRLCSAFFAEIANRFSDKAMSA